MWPLANPAAYCFVWYKPGVAAASHVFTASVSPALKVALVRVRHPDSEAVNWSIAGLGKVKDVFVAVIYVPLGIDRLEVANRHRLTSARLQSYGLDPVEGVLEREKLSHT